MDFSILELKFHQNSETVLTETLDSEVSKLHYYNPFNKEFVKTPLSKNSSLFLEKLRDLYGFNVRTDIFHYPPYVHINRNSTKHVLDVYGPDINFMMQLSNTVNFCAGRLITDDQFWRAINCTKEYNFGVLREFIYNEVQFLAIQFSIPKSCFNAFADVSRGIRTLNQVVLIPILPSETQPLMTEWNLYNVVITFC